MCNSTIGPPSERDIRMVRLATLIAVIGVPLALLGMCIQGLRALAEYLF